MPSKKSWKEKLADNRGLPKVGKIEGKMTSRWGAGTMVIPSPTEVDEIMRKVPKGKLITINEIRALLASKHNVTIGCPISTGIFAWIAANAAAEAARAGGGRITPYWRTLRSGGELNTAHAADVKTIEIPVESPVGRASGVARDHYFNASPLAANDEGRRHKVRVEVLLWETVAASDPVL